MDSSDGLAVIFPLNVHSLDSVKRAAYLFTDAYTFEIRLEELNVVCIIKPLDDPSLDLQAFAGRFRNAVLDQDLREQIAQQTEGLRNVILAHAFSNTGLQE